MSATESWSAPLQRVWSPLRDGWDWWVGELAAMVPDRLRRRLAGRPELSAERRADGGYQITRAGRLVMAAPLARSRPLRVTLQLPRDQVLVRELDLPAMTERDLRRLVSLDIDRLTPFRPEAVYLDLAVLGAGGTPALRRVAVAVVLRDDAARALQAARAAGLDPAALSISGAPAEFDFLPQARQGRDAGRAGRARAWAWGVVVLLALANIAAAVLRDVAATGELREAVSADQFRLQQVLRLRKSVQDEDARRAVLRSERAQGEPLHVLDAVTRATPDGAWVQRLSWTPSAVRLVGYRQETVDVAAALRRSPLFKAVRDSMPNPAQRSSNGQPFDVTADVVQERGP
jgi:general secretion pathway protein L